MSYSGTFMEWFGLRIPILQAPIGSVASLNLVRAVGQAGGTRYVATDKSNAHAQNNWALVNVGSVDTVFTNCFDIGWPYAMHRVLRNETFRKWEAAGCPAAPDRPGDGDIIGRGDSAPIQRYSDSPPLRDTVGNVLDACLYAGTGVDGIDEVEPASTLTARLWAEARQML